MMRCLMLVASVAPSWAWAQTPPAPCLAGDLAFEEAVAAIEADGWQALAPGDAVPEAAADRLAWAFVAAHYASTDMGGESPADLHALQRRAVAGLARKRDTDATRARTLVREDGAMTITRTRTLPDRTEQACLVALAGDEAVGDSSDVARLPPPSEGAPATLVHTRIVLGPEAAR